MTLDPQLGLVIKYDYLWNAHRLQGRREGDKYRPCVVMAIKNHESTGREVMLCPISHAPPEPKQSAVKLPPRVAAHTGLDDRPMWLKTDEVNIISWPAGKIPDGLHPASKDDIAYGILPQKLGAAAFQQIKENSMTKSFAMVRREALEEMRQENRIQGITARKNKDFEQEH